MTDERKKSLLWMLAIWLGLAFVAYSCWPRDDPFVDVDYTAKGQRRLLMFDVDLHTGPNPLHEISPATHYLSRGTIVILLERDQYKDAVWWRVKPESSSLTGWIYLDDGFSHLVDSTSIPERYLVRPRKAAE